jgi:L-aspartate oxidase
LDESGKAIHQALLTQFQNTNLKVDFYSRHMGVDLAIEKNSCGGLFALNENQEMVFFRAKTVILCGGGSGALFERTTNSPLANGDAVALAARKGARIKDLHKVQFHPTAMYLKGERKLPLISEAVRGFGAHLLNHKQERFAFKYDKRGELAARDVLSNAIFKEMEATDKKHLFLRLKHLNPETFKAHFPNIFNECIKRGINPFKVDIPIVPAAHYQCGGIDVNRHGQTSIKNLYAVGECAHTGMHGNNRLASNSLLEAIAYAYYAANAILNRQTAENDVEMKTELKKQGILDEFDSTKIVGKLQAVMTQMYNHRTDRKMLNIFEKEVQDLEQSHRYLFLLPIKSAQEVRNRLYLLRLFLNEWKTAIETANVSFVN